MKWLGVLLVFVVLIGLLFYKVLKSTTKDISHQAPLKQWIGNTYKSSQALSLALNGPGDDPLATYTLQQNQDASAPNSLNLPAGTALTFSKAVYLHKGVSGSEYQLLLGTAKAPDGSEHEFQLYWGNKANLLDPKSAWTYPKPFWE